MRVGRNNEERKEGERKWTKLYVVKKKTRFLFRNGIKKKNSLLILKIGGNGLEMFINGKKIIRKKN